jgi:hypothetical protein
MPLLLLLLLLQGDLLSWLLSSAIAHDTAQAKAVPLRASARDDMLQATMQMRERAMALHLHFPLKFTLSRGTGLAVDARAALAAIMKRVEAVSLLWGDSSCTQLCACLSRFEAAGRALHMPCD